MTKKNLFLIILGLRTMTLLGQPCYSLDQLIDSALQRGYAMRTAQHDIDAAREQRKEARTHYFPTVSAAGGWFNTTDGMARLNLNPADVIPESLVPVLQQALPAEAVAALANPVSMTMMKDGVIGGVTALQPVFAGGQIINGNRLAGVGEQVSQLKMQLTTNQVVLTTEQYYWQLLSLQQKLKTIDAVDSLLASLNKDATLVIQAGIAMRNDLLQVQLRQNELQSSRLKLGNGISLLKMMLAQHCGLRDTVFVCQNITTDPYTMPQYVEPDRAARSTTEYQLLLKNVQATELMRKLEVGKNLPTVAVGAGYNYHNVLDHGHSFGMVMATVTVPISGWWGGSHAIKRRKIERIKAEEQLADNTQMLQIRAQKAWNDLQEAFEQIMIAQRSIDQAQENLRLQRDFYQVGTTTMSDLLEAQMLYQQACDRHTDAQADYQIKLVIYNQSMGLTR